ncbi:MAG: hypothetical protein QNL08_01170 [Ilumatobacteraceae bacterium]
MRKLTTPIMIASLLLVAAPAAMVQGKAVSAKSYSSCASLRKDFPKGVAYSVYTRGTTRAKINKAVYNANFNKLDNGDDGLICENKKKK